MNTESCDVKTFTVNGRSLYAAQLFAAVKDVRYYLCGVFIGKNGDLFGTNGHAAFVSTHDADIDQDYTIAFSQKIPPSAKDVKISIIGDKVIAEIEMLKGSRLISGLIISSAEYPAAGIAKMIPDLTQEDRGVADIGIQSVYIEKAGKVFSNRNFTGVKVSFRSDVDPCVVTPMSCCAAYGLEEGSLVLIMPCRL